MNDTIEMTDIDEKVKELMVMFPEYVMEDYVELCTNIANTVASLPPGLSVQEVLVRCIEIYGPENLPIVSTVVSTAYGTPLFKDEDRREFILFHRLSEHLYQHKAVHDVLEEETIADEVQPKQPPRRKPELKIVK